MRFLQKLNIARITGSPSGGSDGDLIASTNGNLYFRSNGVWKTIALDSATTPSGVDGLLGKKFVPNPSTTNKLFNPVFGAITTQALTAGRCYFMPVPITETITLTHLGIAVTTASTGTAEVALYAGDGSNNLPYTRVAYAGGIDTGSTGDKIVTITSTEITPGLYWAAVRATGTPTIRATATSLVIAISGTTLYRALYNSDAGLTDPVTTAPSALHVNALLVYGRWS